MYPTKEDDYALLRSRLVALSIKKPPLEEILLAKLEQRRRDLLEHGYTASEVAAIMQTETPEFARNVRADVVKGMFGGGQNESRSAIYSPKNNR